MKPALIAAIFLAVVIYLAPRSYGQQAPANGQKESDDQTSLSSGQVHAAAEASHAEHETPHWYKSPEWILVIVGIVTAFFIGRQSWDTRKAAEAALLNAQALINSERARIDGELTQHKIPGTGVVRCSLDVVNQGKTSAKIFGYIIKSRFLTEGADFSKQGMVTLTTVEGYFLIPGNGSRSLRDDFDLDALTANADGIGRTALLITVKYYDVVSEGMERHVRETSLAYIYDRLSATLKRMTEYDEYS